MTEAIISAAAAILVCVLSNFYQNKRTEAQQAKTIELVIYRLDQLEKKQDLHNSVVARVYELERKIGIDEEKIDVANHRIEDLEQFHK